MIARSNAQKILQATQASGKTYAFNESHDPAQPWQTWFQESDEGAILFVVFYSQACRWSRCMGCNLPAQMSLNKVSYRALMAQIDHLFGDPEVLRRRDTIRKVIVSNNGSILDQETFSSTALMYLLAQLNIHLPRMAVLSLETRVEYVDIAELEFIARALAEADTPAQLELAIGFEAFDEEIRNSVFKKGLSLQAFEQLVEKVAPYGHRLKCYFMQKPVAEMTDEAAVADIHNGIDYLGGLAERYGVSINMHLNPTYVATGTPLEEEFRQGAYAPPRLEDVARSVRHADGKPVSIFIGLSDEGLAAEGGSFLEGGDESLVEILEQFNRTQDYRILDRVWSPGAT